MDLSLLKTQWNTLPPVARKATLGVGIAVGVSSAAAFCAGRFFNDGWFAAYVNNDRRLDGHAAIVTGANSGSGYETAKELIKRGCHVIITCRSHKKAEQTIMSLKTELESCEQALGKMDSLILDLCSKKSIDLFLDSFFKLNININILVNNAGAWIQDTYITEDGLEAQWQANYYGPFYITNKLLLHIKKSSQERQFGRIINVSSMGHRGATMAVFDGFIKDKTRGNINYWRNYPSVQVYGDTKCAQILHCKKLQEIINKDDDDNSNLICASVHPGWINSGFMTPNSRILPLRIAYYVFYPIVATFGMVTPLQGAQTTLHCILNDKNVKPGGYHVHCKNAQTHSDADQVIATKTDELYEKSLKIWE